MSDPGALVAAIATFGLAGPALGLMHGVSWRRLALGTAGLGALGAIVAALGGVSWLIWSPALALSCTYLCLAAAIRWHTVLIRFLHSRRLVAGAGVAVSMVLALAGIFWLERLTMPPDLESPVDRVASMRRPDLTPAPMAGFTDNNFRIPLFTSSQDPESLKHSRQAEGRIKNAYAFALIRLAEADLNCNCHGWVFTGGRFWIEGRYVDDILRDNDYREVTKARPGDLIVYRSDDGVVSHTGIVRQVSEGLTLVEGKWGNVGRYLHRDRDQEYGDKWSFYRSRRGGHLLRVEAESPGEHKQIIAE